MFKIAWRNAPGHTAEVKTRDHRTFAGFISTVNRTIESHKKNKDLTNKTEAQWFLRGPATRRTNADLKYSNLIVGDVDDTKVSPQACSSLLTDLSLTHFIYTTSSHTKKAPRYRIVIPHKSDDQDECKRATNYLQKLLGKIKLASESYTWAQEWFLPINGGEVYGHQGNDFEVPKDFEVDKAVVSSGDKGNSDSSGDGLDYSDHLAQLKQGKEIHPHARGMCLALANGGLSENMIFNVVWPEVEAQCIARGVTDLTVRLETVKELAKSAVRKRDNEKEEDDSPVKPIKVDTKSSNQKNMDWPPGMMGELAKSVYQFQRYQDKTLAIMTAFATVAGVAARRHNINDLGLSIYVTILADTGRGKDSIAKFINRVLIEADKVRGINHLGSKGYTGAKALMSALKEKPCFVSVITEAAFTLRNRSGSPESLRKTILDVYTKTGRFDMAVGENYSDEQKNIPSVTAPNFTMINESTPKLFLEAMMENDGAEAGDYGRMFVFRVSGTKPYENEHQKFHVPKKIIDRLKKLIEFNAQIKKDDDPNPVMIERPDDYMKFSRYCTDMENQYRATDRLRSALFSRANEKRLRLIGLMCSLEEIYEPTKEMVDWATKTIELETYNLTRFHEGVGEGIDQQAVLTVGVAMYEALHDDKNKSRGWMDAKILRKHKIVSHGVIRRRTRYRLRQMDDSKDKSKIVSGADKMIQVLMSHGLISEVSVEELKTKYMLKMSKKPAYKMTNELYEELRDYFRP